MGNELVVERRTFLPVSADHAWRWHAEPGWGAFERLAPPWRQVTMLERPAALADGARLTFRIAAGPFSVRWVAEHRDVQPNSGFVDFQVEGPFERWVHHHRFEAQGDGNTMLQDRIACVPPLGLRLGAAWVERELRRMLAYRHALTADELAMHASAAHQPRIHVAVTGASGLLGSALVPALTAGGHRVTRIVRGPAGPGEVAWDPAAGQLDPAALVGVDAVIHLAGENIGARWTPARKRRILESRRRGTGLIAQAMARCARPPATLVSVSAVGLYGDRGDEILTETSAPGDGFLPEVAQEWEDASRPAEAAGVRVVRPRLGVVITPRGSILQRMLLPFRMGIGGRLGSGDQWLSWISIDDVVSVVHRALFDGSLQGSLNAVAPVPVRNRELTEILARLLHRPALVPVPAAALSLLFGEMGEQAILGSTRAIPERLSALGHRFRHPTIEAALSHLLGLG
jgi:uncharacterized protein (TIGR01777 family)